MPFIDIPIASMPWYCLMFLLASLTNLYCLTDSLVCRAPKRYIGLCGALFLGSLLPLTVLTEGCYALYNGEAPSSGASVVMRAPAALWAVFGLILLISGVYVNIRLARWRKEHISRMSIKESVDALPTGLCFSFLDGTPRLVNLRMNALSHALTGHAFDNMDAFWTSLAGGMFAPGNRLVRADESPIVQIADGTVWTFEQKQINMDGMLIRQMTATDTTEEYRLAKQLDEDNARLRKMNERMRRYGETVREVTREKEILDAKVRIHDELGQALIASRRLMAVQTSDEEQNYAVALWRRCVGILSEQPVQEQDDDGFSKLLTAAKTIGVTVKLCGVRPKNGTDTARILLSAAHECLTNAVRHANSTELYVSVERTEKNWTFVLTNNGDIPCAPIREGGGLSSLRRRIEDGGGEMRLSHTPRFKLTILIPDNAR